MMSLISKLDTLSAMDTLFKRQRTKGKIYSRQWNNELLLMVMTRK